MSHLSTFCILLLEKRQFLKVKILKLVKYLFNSRFLVYYFRMENELQSVVWQFLYRQYGVNIVFTPWLLLTDGSKLNSCLNVNQFWTTKHSCCTTKHRGITVSKQTMGLTKPVLYVFILAFERCQLLLFHTK